MECWSEQEIQSKALIALARQMNLSKAIQLLLLLLGHLTPCGPPLPSLAAPKRHSDVVQHPADARGEDDQHNSDPALPRRGSPW